VSDGDLLAAFEVLARCVDQGLVPGAVAAAGTAAGTLHRAAFGLAELAPDRRPMREDALFDLASCTKIVVTTTLALRLLDRGALTLGHRVASILPAFGAGGPGAGAGAEAGVREDVTVRHLLTHTSGLRSGLAAPTPSGPSPSATSPTPSGPSPSATSPTGTASEPAGRAAVLDAIYRQPLAHPPGSAVVYSDLGYIVLGALLEAVAGAPLDALARDEVIAPLGLADATYTPQPALRGRCVATEAVPDRGGTLVGTVHDETAARMGGVSGHAGLFATCADLERYCRLWLNEGTLEGTRLLSPAAVRAATRDRTGPPASRGFGWVLQPNPHWPSAELCSPGAYGHTGFTGTSLVIDPEAGTFAVLLTNRVHPTREGTLEKIVSVRARFHNAVWAALSGAR
jgi:CubicO group peptidase (beta-lactamase class C family)